jgi:D-alanyl-D-alanine carboxypeptidase
VLTSLNNFNRYFLDWYPGAIGVKTGQTDAAGFCVVEEAQRGRRRMLAVVLDGANSYQTAGFLLDRGFATPVASEHSDPELPPVDEPYPPPKHPILRHAAFGGLTAATAGGDPSSVNRPTARDYEIGGGILGVVLAIAVIVVIWARRSRPVGAHVAGRR